MTLHAYKSSMTKWEEKECLCTTMSFDAIMEGRKEPDIYFSLLHNNLLTYIELVM